MTSMSSTRLFSTTALAVSALALPAAGQYQQLYSFSEINPDGGTGNISGVSVIGGELVFTVTDFQGFNSARITSTPSLTPLINSTDLLLAGADNRGVDPNQFFANSPTTAFFGDRLSDGIFTLDLTTNTLTSVATKSDIQAFTGATSSAQAGVGEQALLPGGDLVIYESISDSLIRVTTSGTFSTVATDVEIANFVGNDTINGLTAATTGQTLYFGDSTEDSIYSLDFSSANQFDVVLSASDITNFTGATGVGFNHMLYAEDGNIYFYETTSDSIYSFDPTDAANTLSLVIGEDDLNAGPAGTDFVNGLVWYEDQIAWWVISSTSTREAGLYTVPEPTSLALLGLGGLLALRRRRA